MKKAIQLILCVVMVLFFCSCGVVKGKGEAEKVAEAFFQERINNGWADTGRYYSDFFLKDTGEEKWLNIQKLVTKAMGELKGYSLANWNVQSKVHTNEISGTIVVLVFETSYEKGNGTETLTIHKPLLGDKFSIIGHNINSELIQQLIDRGIEQVAGGAV